MNYIGALQRSSKPARWARICLLLLSSGLASGAIASDASASFEVPPELAPDALLPTSMISGNGDTCTALLMLRQLSGPA